MGENWEETGGGGGLDGLGRNMKTGGGGVIWEETGGGRGVVNWERSYVRKGVGVGLGRNMETGGGIRGDSGGGGNLGRNGGGV